jgi:hypothetical protein
MAHFAELDENNTVKRVVVVHNNELMDEHGVESEQKGAAFCESLFGGSWVQTSYNGNFRKNYAGIGYLYDPIRDAFVPKKPFESWVLNEPLCQWESPVPYPSGGDFFTWDEDTLSWIEAITE